MLGGTHRYHFNNCIFQNEQKAYEEEGLNISKISFTDNKGCLDLIEKKLTGILPMIDEENQVPKGSDDGLLGKLHGTHGRNKFYKQRRGKVRDLLERGALCGSTLDPIHTQSCG